MKQNSGFTLIELMISMLILSFISLGVYQNTSQTFSLREKLEQETSFYNSIRVALDIFGRDINHLYTPQSAAFPQSIGRPPNSAELKKYQTQGTLNNLNFGASQLFWGPAINSFGVRPSRITGEQSKLSFVANNHMRLFNDSAECDFSKITYSLADDPDSQTGEKNFVKTENADVFSRVENQDASINYTLLSHVVSLQFRYLDGEKDRWYEQWDSTSADHQDKFPAIIEILLEISQQNSTMPFLILQRFRPELLQ